MWFLIRVRKRRSRIIDMLFRLEMGLKLERLPGSRLGFLSKGVTRADMKQDGKHPSAKDKLAKYAIRWEKTSEQETISGVHEVHWGLFGNYALEKIKYFQIGDMTVVSH